MGVQKWPILFKCIGVNGETKKKIGDVPKMSKKKQKLGPNFRVGARSGGSVEGSHVEVKEEIRRLASQKTTSHLESLGGFSP